jgi:hypothetical protein
MSEVIISNEVEDYQHCIGQMLRNKHGFIVGKIVDVTTYVMNGYGHYKAVFILEDGRKAYVEQTKFAKRVRHLDSVIRTSRINDIYVASTLEKRPKPKGYDSGSTIYRNGEYVGTVVGKGYDDLGVYAILNNGYKIHLANHNDDELIDGSIEEDEILSDIVMDDE